jgi:predicted nucleic acid-binding protein
MPADVSTRLELIGDLPIATDDETPLRALHEILALARAENLTNYDAAYLELAIRRGLPLATNDKRLRNAAANMGIKIIPDIG